MLFLYCGKCKDYNDSLQKIIILQNVFDCNAWSPVLSSTEILAYLFMSLRKMLITWLVFQLGKCFYTFSYTKFNEKFSGTVRFYLLPLLC